MWDITGNPYGNTDDYVCFFDSTATRDTTHEVELARGGVLYY